MPHHDSNIFEKHRRLGPFFGSLVLSLLGRAETKKKKRSKHTKCDKCTVCRWLIRRHFSSFLHTCNIHTMKMQQTIQTAKEKLFFIRRRRADMINCFKHRKESKRNEFFFFQFSSVNCVCFFRRGTFGPRECESNKNDDKNLRQLLFLLWKDFSFSSIFCSQSTALYLSCAYFHGSYNIRTNKS